MTPYHEAQESARKCGLDFDAAIAEHYQHGYVFSSPDCFILAMESWKDFDKANAERAWFITLAVGDLGQFIRLDPKPEKKWIGFCRYDGGPVHWLDYPTLRRKYSQN